MLSIEPSPRAVAISQVVVPAALDATVTRPELLPSARVRPTANTTLGPGIRMIIRAVIMKAIRLAGLGTWLV